MSWVQQPTSSCVSESLAFSSVVLDSQAIFVHLREYYLFVNMILANSEKGPPLLL